MPQFQDVPSGSTFIHPSSGLECIKLLMHPDLLIEDITPPDYDDEDSENVLLSTLGQLNLRHCFVFRNDLKVRGMSNCYIYILHPEQKVELPE